MHFLLSPFTPYPTLFTPSNPLLLLHFCLGKDRSPMSINRTWHIELHIKDKALPHVSRLGKASPYGECGNSPCSHC